MFTQLPNRLSAEEACRLRKAIARELCANNIPGAAVGLIHEDRAVFLEGFGVTDQKTRSSVTARTVFQIGSVSKMLTAIVLLVLADEGMLELHAPIGLHAQTLDPSLARLTVHQLLTHTAGLKDSGVLYGPRDAGPLSERLAHWDRDYLFTTAGDVFSYSNPGYSLAGLVIERVTNLSFAEAMEKKLFGPVGMCSTAVRANVTADSGFSAGHVGSGHRAPKIVEHLADNSDYRPAGYIYSTVADLCRLTIAVLNRGYLEGIQVLPHSLLNQLTGMHVSFPNTDHQGYGYGLYVQKRRGHHLASHTGFNAGFGARVFLEVGCRSAIVVLTNKHAQTLPVTTEAAIEALMPGLKESISPLAHDVEILRPASPDYTGLYSQHTTKLRVEFKSRRLFLCSNGHELPLRSVGRDRFVYSIPGHTGSIEVLFSGREERGFRYLQTRSRAFRKQYASL